MALWKVLKYVALGIGLLVLAGIALSLIATAVSIVWSILTALVAIAVLAGIGYAGYKGYKWFSSDGSQASEPFSNLGSTESTLDSEPTDPVDRLQKQYTEGRISEAEFERRLSEELGDSADDIDRELERERV